jgi:hypothetical protein
MSRLPCQEACLQHCIGFVVLNAAEGHGFMVQANAPPPLPVVCGMPSAACHLVPQVFMLTLAV